MSFSVGDMVVYPHHGASVIRRTETLEVLGETSEYLVLHIDDASLVIKVRADQAETLGMRDIIPGDEVDSVLHVLRRRDVRQPSNWSRRYKNHVEMLKTGDIYQTAEVVRNLSLRKRDAHLSQAEVRMLAQARRVLVSELHLAMGVTEEVANDRLDLELA